MNVRDSQRDLFFIILLLCVCFTFFAATTSCARENNQSFAGLYGIQSNSKNTSLRAAPGGQGAFFARTRGALHLWSLARHVQVNREAASYEKGPVDIMLTGRKEGIVPGLHQAEGRVDRIRWEGARPKVVPGQAAIGRVSEGHASYLRMRMLGKNEDLEIVPEAMRPGKVSRFTGNDPHKLHTLIPAYLAVPYRNVCRGTDIKFYGNKNDAKDQTPGERWFSPQRDRLRLLEPGCRDFVKRTGVSDKRMV